MSEYEHTERLRIAAVIGPARIDEREARIAQELGELLVDAGFRLITGGMGGVMEAVCQGAHTSARYTPGQTIGLLPTYAREDANAWVDIPLPTGLGHARNALVVAGADVVLACGGRAGTLSELALAWALEKPVIAILGFEGWASRLAGDSIDDRRSDCVHGPLAPSEAVALAVRLSSMAASPTRSF